MALLETGGKTFTIPAGDAVLGSEPGSVIPLTGAGVLPRHAMLQCQADGQVVIRRAVPEAQVTINGVRLGEPTPLLHGDKIVLGGHELTFVDERRKGSTQYIQAMALDAVAGGTGGPAAATGPAAQVPAAVTTGGRVVCLTDGREYQVGDTALVFGRDAVNDVVVPGQDVSRRHAEILHTPAGYVVVDASTNGTFVNEQRVEGRRALARADVIRIGDEQFRFYADTVATAPAPPAADSPGAMERLKDTMHGIPAAVAPPAQGAKPLATFRIKAGTNKGLRLPVRTPVVNIGRADYNDVVLQDPSVSTAHAKLQQREGIWILTDLDSTNGTVVDGERVRGEAALPPGATVRIGDVVLSFDPGDDAVSVAKGGGTQVMRAADLPAGPPAVAPPPSPPPARAPGAPRPRRPVAKAPPPKQGKGCGSSAAVLVVAIAAVAYWMLG